jgi:hypothetical protein
MASARAISISPVRQSVVLDPGTVETISLTVKNDGAETLDIVGSADPFRIDAQTGRAVFGSTDEAKQWVRFKEGAVSIEPGKETELLFTISVPADATPGGHYLGLFAEQKPADGATVGVGSRVGSLLFLYVSGPVQEVLTREVFTAGGVWHRSVPVELFLELANAGSIHAIPGGVIRVESMRGRTLAQFPINPDARKVLPGDVWRQTFEIADLSWRDAGPIRATAFIQYGASQKQITDTMRFWFVPLSVLPIFVLVVFIGVLVWRFIATRTRASRNI